MSAAPTKDDNSFFMRLTIKSLSSKFPTVKNVSTHKVYEWISEKTQSGSGDTSKAAPANDDDPGRVIILDARPPEEYDVSHVVGALRVHPSAELSDVENTISMLKEHDGKQSVVSYCSLGYRGLKYANALSQQLQKEHPDLEKSVNVYNLEGGLFKWANEDKPMVDHKNRPTIYAHPYNYLFGKLLYYNLRREQPEP